MRDLSPLSYQNRFGLDPQIAAISIVILGVEKRSCEAKHAEHLQSEASTIIP